MNYLVNVYVENILKQNTRRDNLRLEILSTNIRIEDIKVKAYLRAVIHNAVMPRLIDAYCVDCINRFSG